MTFYVHFFFAAIIGIEAAYMLVCYTIRVYPRVYITYYLNLHTYYVYNIYLYIDISTLYALYIFLIFGQNPNST